jgi:mono/diheme cytochrome c family protein
MGEASGTRTQRWWRWLLLLVAALAIAGFALAWRPAIPAVSESTPARFSAAQIGRGARLAAVGNCASCHTADPAAPYAGGVPLHTPFGVVYGTNITPEPDTGIGRWSRQAFTRAMRDGISRDGHHLYPAFPYNHYTRLSEDDIGALHAFIMTRDPIRAPARANDMRFPFGFRPLVAGWNLLFLDKEPVAAQPGKDAQWNRGAYLADALGHCGACHTPRNALGAPERRNYLGGGDADGWHAPALNAASPSPLPWTVEQLTTYLRTGIATDHAIAGGPMQGVVTNLASADEQDVRAMALYIHSLMGVPSPQTQRNAIDGARKASAGSLPPPAPGSSNEARLLQLGGQVYQGACARCHDRGRQAASGGALQLPAAIALYEPDPRSLIHIIRDGITPPDTQPGRWMPGFAHTLTDEQVVALSAYLRHHAARLPPWPNLPAAVQKAKQP